LHIQNEQIQDGSIKTSKWRQKELAFFTAATIDAHIREFEKENASIAKDVEGIVTRQTARKAMRTSVATATIILTETGSARTVYLHINVCYLT